MNLYKKKIWKEREKQQERERELLRKKQCGRGVSVGMGEKLGRKETRIVRKKRMGALKKSYIFKRGDRHILMKKDDRLTNKGRLAVGLVMCSFRNFPCQF